MPIGEFANGSVELANDARGICSNDEVVLTWPHVHPLSEGRIVCGDEVLERSVAGLWQ